MIYGSNILSSVVANWQVTNGTVTTDSITLEAGGYAVQNIDLAVLQSIPEYMLLSVVATPYSDSYAMSLIAELKVLSESGVTHTYSIPIVDTGNGVCLVDFPTEAMDHASLTFTFRSTAPVVISDYSLFPPKLSDVDLTEVLDRLPRLLNDYNETPVVVGQAEDIVALISAYVTETTELTGKFTLSYVASEPTEVIIRIKDNEISELYTPMTFKLAPGRGTIGIPHGYLVKRQGYHNFTVTAQVTTGSLRVDTRQVMYIIDGGRIAYGVMDIGAIAYDVTVRKLATETQISYIYAICIDEGMCTVKRAEYTESPGAAWVTVANIGPAIDAAIEFGGDWTFTRPPYTFNTEDDPWIAWVTPTGELLTRRLYSASEPFQIATGVSHVSAVRGWNNMFMIGQDHGLIFVYIKDGSVYYRARATQVNNVKSWEPERTFSLFTGIAVDVNAFRTNDYRVGLNVLDDAGTTHTFLTPRNWAGMAIPAEKVSVGIGEIKLTLVPIEYSDTSVEETIFISTTLDYEFLYAGTAYSIVEINNIDDGTGDYGKYILCRFTHNFKLVVPSDFYLVDELDMQFSVSNFEQTGFREYMFEVSNFNNAVGVTSFVCTALGTTNEAGTSIAPFSKSFTPVNLEPLDIPLPELEVLWNE
jgi:hypothetical protein